MDTKLRTGYKELSDEDLETLFDRVLILFRFINGVFNLLCILRLRQGRVRGLLQVVSCEAASIISELVR